MKSKLIILLLFVYIAGLNAQTVFDPELPVIKAEEEASYKKWYVKYSKIYDIRKQTELKHLIYVIQDILKKGNVIAYDPDTAFLSKKMDYRDIELNLGASFEWISVEDPETNELRDTFVYNEPYLENVLKYYCVYESFFNSARSVKMWRLIAICPLLVEEIGDNEGNVDVKHKQVCWLKYKDIRSELKKYKVWYNDIDYKKAIEELEGGLLFGSTIAQIEPELNIYERDKILERKYQEHKVKNYGPVKSSYNILKAESRLQELYESDGMTNYIKGNQYDNEILDELRSELKCVYTNTKDKYLKYHCKQLSVSLLPKLLIRGNMDKKKYPDIKYQNIDEHIELKKGVLFVTTKELEENKPLLEYLNSYTTESKISLSDELRYIDQNSGSYILRYIESAKLLVIIGNDLKGMLNGMYQLIRTLPDDLLDQYDEYNYYIHDESNDFVYLYEPGENNLFDTYERNMKAQFDELALKLSILGSNLVIEDTSKIFQDELKLFQLCESLKFYGLKLYVSSDTVYGMNSTKQVPNDHVMTNSDKFKSCKKQESVDRFYDHEDFTFFSLFVGNERAKHEIFLYLYSKQKGNIDLLTEIIK